MSDFFSDAPAPEPEAPAPAESAQPTDSQPDTEQPPADAPPKEADESKKALRGVQKRIDELTREKYAERAERQRIEQELSQLRQAAQQQQFQASEPKVEQFQDYTEFVRAHATWTAKNAAESVFNERMKQMMPDPQAYQQQMAMQAAQQAKDQAVQRTLSEGAKHYPDFAKIVQSAEVDLSQSPAVLEAVLTSEQAPHLSVYLAKNPEVAFQLVNMHPAYAIRQIGRLEASLSSKRTTQAPPPPSEVGSGEKAKKSEDEMSMSEWMKHMDSLERKRRNGK